MRTLVMTVILHILVISSDFSSKSLKSINRYSVSLTPRVVFLVDSNKISEFTGNELHRFVDNSSEQQRQSP